MRLFIKTMVVIITAVVMMCAAAVSSNAVSSSYMRGDVNGDGQVTVADATLVQQKVAEMDVPNFNMKAADVDGNGLYVSDATWIQRYAAEFEENPYHVGEVFSDDPEPSRDEYELPFVPI